MTLRIRITKQTSIAGDVARVGDIIDADRYAAEVLIRMGKAELVVEEDEPTPTRKPRTRRKAQ